MGGGGCGRYPARGQGRTLLLRVGFAVILSSRWGKAGLWVHFRGSFFDVPS